MGQFTKPATGVVHFVTFDKSAFKNAEITNTYLGLSKRIQASLAWSQCLLAWNLFPLDTRACFLT